MKLIKKFDSFLSEKLVAAAEPAPVTTPTPTTTPTTPKPNRPGITPTEVPSEEDSPLASAQKVIDRFESVYNNASDEDKKEIDSYFEK